MITNSYYRNFGKRVFDLVVALIALILLSPIYTLIFCLIFVRMGSPVLFSQDRPGRYGKLFKLFKFRTMILAFDSKGIPLPDNERLTRLGVLLRKTSLDELPEIYNVLKGDMSLVGPRPLLSQYIERYTTKQMRRHEVKPGVTGWAQVNGRNNLSWEEKFELDVWYVDNCSFWVDVKILFKTVIKVLKREGISQPGAATMEEFKGSQS